MRDFRGDKPQGEFGAEIGKRQTVISRLENPIYGGWSLRTMLEIARKLNLAVFCRFVDFPTFLKLSDDLSEAALRPKPYNAEIVSHWAHQQTWTALYGRGTMSGLPPEVQKNYDKLMQEAAQRVMETKPAEDWAVISVSNPGKRIVVQTTEAAPSVTNVANDTGYYTVSDAAE